jgi:hypothetical protein
MYTLAKIEISIRKVIKKEENKRKSLSNGVSLPNL